MAPTGPKGIKIEFTVTQEAAAYLSWLGRNVLLVKNEKEAAQKIVTDRIQELRSAHLAAQPDIATMLEAYSKEAEES